MGARTWRTCNCCVARDGARRRRPGAGGAATGGTTLAGVHSLGEGRCPPGTCLLKSLEKTTTLRRRLLIICPRLHRTNAATNSFSCHAVVPSLCVGGRLHGACSNQ